MSKLIATFFFVGYLRPAPGTWGSLAALPVAFGIAYLSGFWGLIASTLIVFVIGTWATQDMTRGSENHDPSEIVIDEVVGQWIALAPVIYGAISNDVALSALWPGWLAAFGLFRLFDITKPGPVGWVDRRGDAIGVMLDDVIAGGFAALGVIALAGLAHGVFGA